MDQTTSNQDAIRVYISADHIVAGSQTDRQRGPLSLALQEAGYPPPEVGDLEIGVGGRWYVLDPEAQEWLAQFENNQSIGPVWFTLAPRP